MKKTVPDEQRIQTILDLICALDGRIMKVERDGNTLIVYANIQSYEGADSPADTDTDDYTHSATTQSATRPVRSIKQSVRKIGDASTSVPDVRAACMMRRKGGIV